MTELLSLLQNYNPIAVIIILVLTFVAAEWILEKYKKVRTWFLDYRESYHQEENAKEEKEETLESRLSALEKNQDKDYKRIKSVESNLYELKEQNGQQNKMLSVLNDAVRDLRVQSIRNSILDFYQVAINLSMHPSREAYAEVIRNYEIYEQLMDEKGEKNGYLNFTYDKIIESMDQRDKYKLYAENFIIKPSKEDFNKEPEIIEGFDD